jgi:L-rhamnose mutarotase
MTSGKEEAMRRIGMAMGIRPEKIGEYKRLHAAAWPGVLAKISDCNMKNFSIFLREPENLLFAYFEYHGADLAADSARMAADPITQEWWSHCNPCQQPFDSRQEGEWWASMEPVFFHA